MSKHCAVCHKELPEDAKIPLCEYHIDKGKEKGGKVAVAFAGVVIVGLKVVKDVGVKGIKKAGPAAANAIRAVIKR